MDLSIHCEYYAGEATMQERPRVRDFNPLLSSSSFCYERQCKLSTMASGNYARAYLLWGSVAQEARADKA